MIGFRHMRTFVALIVFSLALTSATTTGQEPGSSGRSGAVAAHRPSVPGTRALVTSGHPLVSMAGMRILQRGGNAFDAAVAMLATANVVEFEMNGAGGNGFMTLYDKKTGKVSSLNMTGAAPKALKIETMTAETISTGVKAGLVPGAFGGWIAVLDKHGTMSLAELFETAIDYAGNGFPLDPANIDSIRGRKAVLERFPTSAKIFLPSGNVPVAGQLFKQADLAATFKKLAEAEQSARKSGESRSEALRAAFDRFYKGDIAQEFARFFKANDALLAAEDFAAYKPKWAEPVHTTYRGYDVYSSPSTSRGGIEMMMQLNIIEGFDLKSYGFGSRETLHLVAESIKLAKSDVYQYVADPAFTQIPLAGLLSKEYAAERRKLIALDRAMTYPAAGRPDGARRTHAAALQAKFDERAEDGHTTTFSVVDPQGNVVACTPTLGSGFGTGVVVGSTGLFFNNGMRIGSSSPYPDNVNYARPGQIPLLNNSPLIVMKDGKFMMAYGSPGGETIGQTEFQVLLNVIEFGMRMQEAIEAPRFALNADPNFYKPGSAISWNLESRIKPEVVKALEAMGHKIKLTSEFGGPGSNHGILVNLATGTMMAGADPRRTGYAVGW